MFILGCLFFISQQTLFVDARQATKSASMSTVVASILSLIH